MSEFSHDSALALWEALISRKCDALLSFSHHERMMPPDTYAVSVPVGPGSFPADKLQEVMAIADEHGYEAHLIGNGLRLLPKRAVRP